MGRTSGRVEAALLALALVMSCGSTGCAESYLLGTNFGSTIPAVGSGEVAVSPYAVALEAHGGTTAVFEDSEFTRLGFGLGLSHRVRTWRGISDSLEFGPHVFHLSRRSGHFAWSSRAGLFLGLADRDGAVGSFVFSGQAMTQAMFFPALRGTWKPVYVSLGGVFDATAAPPDGGSALSVGGVIGVGLAFFGKRR